MMISGRIHQVAFPDSDESLAILSHPSWFSIPSTAERGWRYLNHPENAPSVTSELLVEKKKKKKKHQANLSPNICPAVWSSHIFSGPNGLLLASSSQILFSFWPVVAVFLKSRYGGGGGGQQRGQRELVARYKFLLVHLLVGRSRHCALALICVLMGNKQQLNQLLALCVIFKDERTPKTMKPLPWGFL